MTEAQYQSKIIKALEAKGYYVLRLISTNKNGIPDLLALKHCEVWFIEVKGANGKISKLQEYREKEIRKHSFKHTYAFSGDGFIDHLQNNSKRD